MSIADELRKLQELRQAGVLTDEEFATAKASVLASLPRPPFDKAVARVKEELEQFKARFAAADGRELLPLLESAEDLLIHVIGEARYRELKNSAHHFMTTLYDRAHTTATEREYRPRYDECVDSLKRRVAGIEYRK